ncbi:MAG: hypothetical protein WAZ27_02440 [Minisyncoccia bacterium]
MKKIGGYALALVTLIWTAPAFAGGAFSAFEGSGKADGTIWLVGKPGAESTKCSRNAKAVSDDSLSFSLSCSGGKSFSLSCSLKASGTRISGSCRASIATLTGGGSIRGNVIRMSMKSNFGSHANMTITPSSLSFRSPDARYVKSLQISGL